MRRREEDSPFCRASVFKPSLHFQAAPQSEGVISAITRCALIASYNFSFQIFFLSFGLIIAYITQYNQDALRFLKSFFLNNPCSQKSNI